VSFLYFVKYEKLKLCLTSEVKMCNCKDWWENLLDSVVRCCRCLRSDVPVMSLDSLTERLRYSHHLPEVFTNSAISVPDTSAKKEGKHLQVVA